MAGLFLLCACGGPGKATTTGGEAAAHAVVWNLEDRDTVEGGSTSPIGGAAAVGSQVSWFQVLTNKSGELMICVRATDVDNGQTVIGYIACTYIDITSPADLTELEQACSDSGD